MARRLSHRDDDSIDVMSMSNGSTGSSNDGDAGLWHIKPDGAPGKCHAKNGKCPYGASNHYHSKAEAYAAHEEMMKQDVKRLSNPLNRKDLDSLMQGELPLDADQDTEVDAPSVPEAQSYQPNAQVPRSRTDDGSSGVLNENGVDEGHARWLRETAFSDDVVTAAPLARIPGVPARLQPLEQDYADARASWENDWTNPATKAFLASKGIDVNDLISKQGMLESPSQDTYMGMRPDGSDAIPPEGDPRRKEVLDEMATVYDQRLYDLEQKYAVMRKAFEKDYKGEYLTDYSCARMLTHWGRSLEDEKAYIESLGGKSRFDKPDPEWLVTRKRADAERKAKWEAEHPGEEYKPPVYRRTPFSNKELDSEWTARRVSKDALIMQGA